MQSFMASEGLNFDAPTGMAEVQAHAIPGMQPSRQGEAGTPGNCPMALSR